MSFGRALFACALSIGVVAAGCSSSDDEPDASDEAIETSTTAPTPTADDQPSSTGQDPTSTSATARPTASTTCQAPEPGIHQFETAAGGPTIEVRVLVPADQPSEPLPAVIDFHGLGSSGLQQATLSGYEDLAEEEGFVAVHPTGSGSGASTAAAWELAQFDVPTRDDLAMFDDLIDRLVDDYCVDRNRVYSTGLSNGGFFTALLVCERADRIAAAVSVAGLSHPDGCRPSRPVPYLAYHGTDDQVIRYEGGGSELLGGAASTPAAEAFFDQSMPIEMAEFAADFGCQPEPATTRIGDEVLRHDYQGCADGIPVSFVEIEGGGHTWPSSPLGPLLTGALGHTTDDVDATADGWAFMSQFSLPEG